MSKILVVEDNEMNRDMLTRRLERKGFEVVVAINGKVGIDMASSSNPDIILMDLSLPVIDGWEATRQIKADPATQSIPVIALTAHAMAGDESSRRCVASLYSQSKCHPDTMRIHYLISPKRLHTPRK